jgi:hypothetical protein
MLGESVFGCRDSKCGRNISSPILQRFVITALSALTDIHLIEVSVRHGQTAIYAGSRMGVNRRVIESLMFRKGRISGSPFPLGNDHVPISVCARELGEESLLIDLAMAVGANAGIPNGEPLALEAGDSAESPVVRLLSAGKRSMLVTKLPTARSGAAGSSLVRAGELAGTLSAGSQVRRQ